MKTNSTIACLRPALIGLTTLALAGTVVSANNALWIGNAGVSATTNWSDNANWNNVGTGGAGPNQNDVRFGGTGSAGSAGIVTSVVDTMAGGVNHPFSLNYTNAPGQFHTTLIPAGIIVTNDNGLIVGGLTGDAYTTVAWMAGAGTLQQNGTTVTVQNYGSTVSTALATLDLSGLSNFIYTASAGTIGVGTTGGNRSAGAFNLAGVSNNITVGTINLGTGSGANAATSNLRLGAGTNIINVTAFNIVNNKNSATLSFHDATGGLRLRGVGGTDSDRANFVIGNRNQTGTGTATGTLSLNGHQVDIKAGTITNGQNSASSSVNIGAGVINFDTGILDATTINMAVCSNPGSGAAANGTITVGSGGTLIIGSGGLSLVNRTGSGATGTGNLNISGTVISSNSIVKTTSAASTGNITMTGGLLNLVGSGKTIGTAAIPIDTISLASATLQLSVASNSTNVFASTLTLVDNANTVNIAALPILSGYPSQFPIISYASGGGDMILGTLPSTYTGYLSNDTVSVIWLVITNGPSTSKAVQWGGGVNNNWDKTSFNWTNSGTAVTYAEGDSVTFDDLAQTGNVSLTAGRGPLNLTVTNNTLNYTFSGSGSITGAVALVKQGTASLTLTEIGGDNFSGGIFVVVGKVVLDDTNCAISGGVNISSGATLQVGVNDENGALPVGSVQDDGALIFSRTNSVLVTVPINGAGALTSTGKGTLTLSSTNGYTGNTFIGNGTLALTGIGAITASAQVICSNATFDVSGAAGPVLLSGLSLSNSIISVTMTNLQTPIAVASLGMGGSGNAINVASLPPIASYPSTLTLIQSAGAISGFNLTLGTLPSASPAYAGNVTQSGDGLAVLLTLTAGPVGVRPNVTWSGADAIANVNTNWSDRLNWQLPGAPAVGDNVIFNNAGTQTASALSTPGGGSAALIPENINNIVDTNFTIATLTFTNTGGTYHNTSITNGATLTVTNIFTVGAIDSASTAQQEYVNFAGTRATLSVNNTNSNLQVWLGDSGTALAQATLDLSALDNFTANISRLTVGASAVNNAVNRPSGILYLAKTNTINCAFQTTTSEAGTTTGNSGIVVSDCNQNNGPASFIYLGQVNTIAADTIGIARQKTTASILFNPTYANVAPYPTVTFKGFSSSLVSIFDIGDAIGNAGTTTGTGTLNLSGGQVTAAVDTMNIGRSSSGGTAGTTTGVLQFDAGTITANTVNVGFQPTNNTKVAVGTVSVNTNTTIGVGANLVVNSNLNLGVNGGGGGAATTSGTLNINGGTVQANNIVAGLNGATSTINLNSGTLSILNVAGTPDAPLTTLNLSGGAIQLILNGSGTPTNIVATTVNANGTTTINIGSVVNAAPNTTVQVPLISYTTSVGSDPYSGLVMGTVPAGCTSPSLIDNTANQTIDLQITTPAILVPTIPPGITGFNLANGNVVINGTNGQAGRTYYLLSTTNLTLPRNQWVTLATNVLGSANFVFIGTNAATPNRAQQFYILSSTNH